MIQVRADRGYRCWLTRIACLSSSLLLTLKRVIDRLVVVLVLLALALERIVGNIVQPDHRLVRILHYQVLAVLLLHANVDDTSEDTPSVVHVEIDLRRELIRLVLLRAEDHVLAGVAYYGARHISEFQLIRAGQQCLHRPLGELARVIAQLVGQDRAALRVQLLPPLDPVGDLRVPLVQRLDRQELVLVVRALHHGVVLATGDQHDAVVEVPLAITVRHARHVALLLLGDERIALLELVARLVRLEHLLREIVIDEGRLEGEVARRVQRVAVVLRRFHARLVHGQQIELGIVALVEKQLVADLLDDDVPRVIAARAAHNGGQYRVGGVHVALGLGQLANDGIVGGGHRVEDPIDSLQRLLALHVHAVVRLVVILERAAAQYVLAVLHAGQRELSQPREVHLLDGHPVRSHRHGCISYLDRRLVLVIAQTLLSAPALRLSLALAFSQLQLTQLLHLAQRTALTAATAHVALIVTEATALIRRLLHASSVHQVKTGLVFVVIIGILAARTKLRCILVWKGEKRIVSYIHGVNLSLVAFISHN